MNPFLHFPPLYWEPACSHNFYLDLKFYMDNICMDNNCYIDQNCNVDHNFTLLSAGSLHPNWRWHGPNSPGGSGGWRDVTPWNHNNYKQDLINSLFVARPAIDRKLMYLLVVLIFDKINKKEKNNSYNFDLSWLLIFTSGYQEITNTIFTRKKIKGDGILIQGN